MMKIKFNKKAKVEVILVVKSEFDAYGTCQNSMVHDLTNNIFGWDYTPFTTSHHNCNRQ